MKRALALLLTACLCLSGMIVAIPTARADTSLAWEQVGQPMGKVWWPVVDPKDASHVYVVAEQGLYCSLDAGQSWERIWAGSISWEIQILSTSMSRYLFICNQQNAYYSTDDGETWQPLNPPTGRYVASIHSVLGISSDNQHITVFVGNDQEIARSSDLGKTWQTVSQDAGGGGFGAYYLWGSPSNSQFVLALTQTSYTGSTWPRSLYRSFDAGDTWQKCNMTTPLSGSTSPNVMTPCRVAVHPADPHVLYLMTGERVFGSSDCGDTWQELMNGLRLGGNLQGFVLDSEDRQSLWLAKSDGLFVSSDAGASWVKRATSHTQRNGSTPWTLTPVALNVLVQAVSSPDTWYATTGTSLYVSKDHCLTWARVLEGDVSALWGHQWSADGSRLYAEGSGGIWISADNARSWSVLCDYAGTVCAVAQSPVDQRSLFATATDKKVLVSRDEGASWAIFDTPAQFGIIIADSKNVGTLYASDFNVAYTDLDGAGKTYKSVDAGRTWTQVLGGLPIRHCMAMAVSPSDSSRVVWASRREVYLSRDAGTSWKLVMQLQQPGITWTAAFSPTAVNTMYISTETDGVLRSTDGGVTWAPATAGMSVTKYWHVLAVKAASPYRLFISTAYGVFESDDGANSWIPVNNNAVGVSFKQLSCSPLSGGTAMGITAAGTWMQLTQRLQPPADVKAESQKSAIRLSWSSVAAGPVAPVAYAIWRSTDAGFGSPVRIGHVSADTTVYTDTTIWGFKPYYYKVGAWDGRETTEQVLLSTVVSAAALDDIPPVITLKSPSTNPWTSSDAACSLSFGVADAETGVASVTVDGSTTGLSQYYGTYTKSLTLEPGWRQVLIVARDTVGNATQVPVRIRYIRTTVVQIHPAVPFMSAYISPGYRPVSVKTVRSRTFVPVRDLAEALGAQVSWDAGARKATLTRGTTTVVLWIGNPTALVNGVHTPIDAKDTKVIPFIEGGKTYMPVNFVASSFGAAVSYDATTRIVTVTLKEG
ncbi:MAG: stalk domain-containing protein [Candidatus Cryosericum sp.]